MSGLAQRRNMVHHSFYNWSCACDYPNRKHSTLHFLCRKGCKSRNSLIYTFVCGERGKWIFLASPCLIVLYKLSSFLCSQIVAITEYFESTRGYCCSKYALVFLEFKSTKKMNMLQIFDRKCFIDSLATIFSARCSLPYILYHWLSIHKMVLYYQKMVF